MSSEELGKRHTVSVILPQITCLSTNLRILLADFSELPLEPDAIIALLAILFKTEKARFERWRIERAKGIIPRTP
jgi:hypothetical protein